MNDEINYLIVYKSGREDVHFNIRTMISQTIEIKIVSKGFCLVAAQVIIEAYSRVIIGYAFIYTHISVLAC